MQNIFFEVSSLDRRCCDAYGLNEALLMEHAAEAMAVVIRARFAPDSRVIIVCGPGNNGADGMALARLLHGSYDVALTLPFGTASQTGLQQRTRAERLGVAFIDALEPCDILVDALFGSGLSRPINDLTQTLITQMNTLDAFKLACDMPTGVQISGECSPIVFMAERTVTMGALKRGMFSDAAKQAVGEITVADLGVDRSFYETEAQWQLLERSDLILPLRHRANVHKGSFGHLGVVCGEKSGAAIIAGRAALRFGAGLVTLLSNEEVSLPYELMQSHLRPGNVNAVAVGMGLGQEFAEEELKERIDDDIPLVCDADIFAHPILPELLKRKKIVLTPHPREFAVVLRAVGLAAIDAAQVQSNRFTYVERFCRAYPDAVLVLKGANVIIGQGERYFINPHGTNALAKGGSGDVLTGLVGALLAQGHAPLDAAINASLAHTEASCRFEKNSYALTPDDLIEGICTL